MRRGPSPGLLSAQAHSTAWKEGQGALRPVSPRAAPVIGPDPQQAHVSQWEDASLMPSSQKLGLCWNFNFKPPSPNLRILSAEFSRIKRQAGGNLLRRGLSG